jgi:hypothetical protein
MAKLVRVEFRKDEPKETPMPTIEERICKSMVAATRGDASFADAALEQQKIAREMFPLAKSVGEALHQYSQTDIGKSHIAWMARTEYAKQQFDTRTGDAFEKVESDKDDAGYVRGSRAKPKVRHADNDHAKKPRKATSHDGYSGDQDPDPNRVNNYSDRTVEARMAKICDVLAETYAAEHGVSKFDAYSELMKTNPAFGLIWKAATALPVGE